MKKFCCLILCTVLFTCLVGCNEVYELTDEETKVIAEYAADLLLKYDISFDDRISEGEYKLAKQEERGEDVTTEAETSENSASEESTSEEPTTESNHGEYVSGIIGEDADQTDASSMQNESDIAKIIGREDLSITYQDYMITKQYPATDDDGKFIYLEASEGFELFVVQFRVANLSSQITNLSLIDEEIDYKILCNDTKAAKPMLTILMDDLSTLETTIEPGQEQEAVLVFQISDSLKDNLEKIQLFVQYNGVDNIMEIQ